MSVLTVFGLSNYCTVYSQSLNSILDPILFLCYINGFYSATTLFSVLFADDTTCLSKGKVLKDLIDYVNGELQKIAMWFRSNKMAVNTSKTKFIIFRTRGKMINDEYCVLLFNNNEPGQPVDPDLISQIDRIHNGGDEKCFNCWEYSLTNICPLTLTFNNFVLRSPSHCSVSIELKISSTGTP